MAEKYGFFDPIRDADGKPDRDYNAQQFTDYFRSLVTTGIMKGRGNQLSVGVSGGNMVSTIETGLAFVEGRYYENDSPLNLTHDTETLGKNRIDRIVIRSDENTNARHVRAFIKKGVASASPVTPALTQNDMVYEISLAQILIVGGQTYINTDGVTDERGTDDICPWAGSNILPNFNDEALAQLISDVENMYQLTNGPNLKDYSAGALNDLTETGLYFSLGATLARNFPLNSPTSILSIEVLRGSGVVFQRLIYLTGATTPLLYHRVLSGGKWSAWVRLPVGISDSLDSQSNNEAASSYAVSQKANKQQEALIPLSGGMNGWNINSTRYFKDEFGMVHLFFSALVGTRTGFIQIGTMPTGYRPSRSISFVVAGSNAMGDTTQLNRVHINNVNGHMYMEFPTGGTMYSVEGEITYTT